MIDAQSPKPVRVVPSRAYAEMPRVSAAKRIFFGEADAGRDKATPMPSGIVPCGRSSGAVAPLFPDSARLARLPRG